MKTVFSIRCPHCGYRYAVEKLNKEDIVCEEYGCKQKYNQSKNSVVDYEWVYDMFTSCKGEK